MTRRRRLVLCVLAATGGLFLVASVVVPWIDVQRHTGGRTRNGDRMHQIGLAILLYNQDHAGSYPPTLDDLLRAEGLNAELARCTDDGAVNPPPMYVYLGRDLTSDTADFTTVVAYTPLPWAAGRGSDVLFGDGHLDWVWAADLPAVLARGGPTTAPATRPATTPAR